MKTKNAIPPPPFTSVNQSFTNEHQSQHRANLPYRRKIFLSFLFILFIIMCTNLNLSGQTVLVNYDFNSGSSYSNLSPALATNIASTLSCTEAWQVYTGTASGTLAFAENTTAGNAIAMANSSGTNTRYWSFSISGADCALYKDFKLYTQLRRSSAGAQTITIATSTDGSTYTNFGTTLSLSSADTYMEQVFDLSTVTTLNNKSTVYIRIMASGASGTGTLRLDNLQLQGLKTSAPGTNGIFDSLHVINRIEIGNSIWIDAAPNTSNNIYTDGVAPTELLIQSNAFFDNNTILNYGNNGYIGIGTLQPNYKLSLHNTETTTSSPDNIFTKSITTMPFCCTYLNDSILAFSDSLLNNARVANSGIQLYDNEPTETVGTTTFQITNVTTELGTDAGLKINLMGQNASICLDHTSGGKLTMQAPGGVGLASSSGTVALRAFSGSIFMQGDFYNIRTNTTPNAMRIDANGNVGIGTNTPSNKFQVGQNTGKVILDNALGAPDYVTGYVGFNAGRVNGSWIIESDGFSNGGSAIVSNVGGQIRFITYPKTSPMDLSQTITDIAFFAKTAMIITAEGKVGIGTDNPGNYSLAVEGSIAARLFKVTLDNFYDNVFEENYQLPSIKSVEEFIEKNKHLPDIPSESEVLANGIDIGAFNALLLKKIEELTLYIIEQNKRIEILEKLIVKD